ncbi:MAG: RHS repeat-associated core domain-containing protein [Nitrospiria bacterium]
MTLSDNLNNTISTCKAQNYRICTIQTTVAGNLTQQNLQYTYDSKGNISQITDVINGNQTFAFDELDRLTTATGPYGTNSATTTVTYAYNPIGNIMCNSYLSACTSATPNYTYTDTAHKHAVTNAAWNSYVYDANGNMTQQGYNNLVYDYENRLISVTNPALSSPTTMVYDGDGGRVKKTVNGITTIYIGKLYECTGTTCMKYIFAGDNRIAVRPVSGGGIYYYHTDHLGSSSLMTDASGNLAEIVLYLPFGQTRWDDGAINTAYKYTGQYFDSETRLYFYGARYYDPALGRFISADTIVGNPSDPQSLNRYSYVRNNPIINTDPTGHDCTPFTCLSSWVPPPADQIVQQVSNGLNNISNNISDEANRFANSVSVGSQAGQEIGAGVIIVATAVATWYCAGCGAYSFIAGIYSGALIGEIAGGYSAYQSGGDILKGVIVGGVVGGITGAATGGLANYYKGLSALQGWQLYASKFFTGALMGAISGGGLGAITGYEGGKGDLNSIAHGALLGAEIGAASGGALGIFDATNTLYMKGWPADLTNCKIGCSSTINNLQQFLFQSNFVSATYGIGAAYSNYLYQNRDNPSVFNPLLGTLSSAATIVITFP